MPTVGNKLTTVDGVKAVYDALVGAPKSLIITTDDTLATIITKLNQFGSNDQGVFSCANGTVASLLTAGNVTSTYRGVIARLNDTRFDLFGSVGSGSTFVAGRIEVSSNSITSINFTTYSPPSSST